MKKAIILQHEGNELANQLWNFVSIYAYCREKGYRCQNNSFFEYGQYFNIPVDNKLINLIFFTPFKNHHGRRSSKRTKFWRFIYKIYAKAIALVKKKRIVSSVNFNNKKFYLSPTEENYDLAKLEKDNNPIYFAGWLFRNPDGLKKYRKEILAYFKPKDKYTKPAEDKINELRKKYKNVIGVHIRQTDFREHKGGRYFITQKRIREILDEYLVSFQKNIEETVFVFASDGEIEKGLFAGLNASVSKGNAIEDLYVLSLCDVIIGSNSSFGNFASFYGDIPQIVFQKEKMDWNYYRDKKHYFNDKHSVMNLE